MLGAQFGSPPEAVHHVGTGIALAASGKEETELTAEVGVGFDAPGRLGERPGSFRARGTVVSQEIYPGPPHDREQSGFHT